jgi:hypothetical protein
MSKVRHSWPKLPWHRCDWCGRFISLFDFNHDRARRRMVSPDTAFTEETYENKCQKCIQNERKP